MRTRKDIILRKDEILKWIKDDKQKNFICKELKCRPVTLNNWLKKLGITYKGCSNWAKGKTFQKIPIEKYLQNGTHIISDKLKKKLFESGIKNKICENPKCRRTKWCGKEIPLELHHIDGDKNNNELSNLQILCSNCHSQTSNFCKQKTIIKQIFYCCCGRKKNKLSNLCDKCYKLSIRKVERPSLQILLDDIKNNSYLEVGRKYSVSDNCIRKWIKSYGEIPPKKLKNERVWKK